MNEDDVVEVEAFYQHKDGGVYFTTDVSSSTVDQSRWVVYLHLFPFEQKTWHRPIAEWTPDRFRKLTPEEADEIMEKDRDAFAAEITARKNTRKGQV